MFYESIAISDKFIRGVTKGSVALPIDMKSCKNFFIFFSH